MSGEPLRPLFALRRVAGSTDRNPLFKTFRRLLHGFLLRGVKAISRSQLNDGYGADCGRSRGGRRRGAIRPIEASNAAIPNGRFTSTPAVRFAEIAIIRHRRGKTTRPLCLPSTLALGTLRCATTPRPNARESAASAASSRTKEMSKGAIRRSTLPRRRRRGPRRGRAPTACRLVDGQARVLFRLPLQPLLIESDRVKEAEDGLRPRRVETAAAARGRCRRRDRTVWRG
jgi:hypothetical protein